MSGGVAASSSSSCPDSLPLPLLWACFPVELCHGQGEHAIALRRAHLASASFRQVPRLARGCSALLPGLASERALLVLDGLHSELRARAWGEGLPDATAVRLQRSLFLCAVVLLRSLLERTPPTATLHDEAALCTLAALALGAVAVDELEPLERLLLDQLQRTGRLTVLVELALPGAGPMSPLLEARRWVVLRWVERAMQSPGAMAQLQLILPPLLALATSLPRPLQPSAGLLRAALSQLAVEEEAQLQTAAGLLAQLGSDCGRLLEHEASLAQPLAVAAAHEPPEHAAPQLPHSRAPSRVHAAAALCPLLFALVPAVKEPLLPSLLGAAEQVVLGAQSGWQRARCCAQLFEAISQSFNYYRKQQLVQWALALQRRLQAGVASSQCETMRCNANDPAPRPGTPHPAPRARS